MTFDLAKVGHGLGMQAMARINRRGVQWRRMGLCMVGLKAVKSIKTVTEGMQRRESRTNG
jgi:hypothetical protein